jgi:hypothetical protein
MLARPVAALLWTVLAVLVCRGATAEAPLWMCPGGVTASANNSLMTLLPATRTMFLRAEAKSGTTWLQLVVTQLLLELCEAYNNFTDGGFACEASCLVRPHEKITCTSGSQHNPPIPGECALRGADACRHVIIRLTDNRHDGTSDTASTATPAVVGLARGQTSVLRVEFEQKHEVPFISDADHPNHTPVLRGVPDWLEVCVVAGFLNCTPPVTSLRADLELNDTQVHDVFAGLGVFSAVDLLRLQQRRHVSPGGRAAGLITILRDPRSVTSSAAHFNPGAYLFGLAEAAHPKHVSEFVQGSINMTTAWTQFRAYWFRTLNASGMVPVFSTFYEVRTVRVEQLDTS